jgi:hypothetical protein
MEAADDENGPNDARRDDEGWEHGGAGMGEWKETRGGA